MTAPPNEVLARETRRLVEDMHDEWDAPSQFVTLHWNGAKISYGVVACLMLDIHPTQLPRIMAELVSKQARRRDLPPMCACIIQSEVHGVTEPGPDASVAERLAYDRDRAGRTFHQRPDAVEAAVAYCADTYGFLWSALKTREDPGTIVEQFYKPGAGLGGQLIAGVLAAARLPVVAGN
jgi:hypothetical protein